jgi:hypothetical protein
MTLPASILEPLIALLLPKLEEIVIEQASKCLQDALLDITHPGTGGPGLAPMKPGFTTAQAGRSLMKGLKPIKGAVPGNMADLAWAFRAPARSKQKPDYLDGKPKPVTKTLQAARLQQGKWLGTLRRLAGKDRARVKALREREGYAAAFKLADKLAPRIA